MKSWKLKEVFWCKNDNFLFRLGFGKMFGLGLGFW
jgi:hypothetical protein